MKEKNDVLKMTQDKDRIIIEDEYGRIIVEDGSISQEFKQKKCEESECKKITDNVNSSETIVIKEDIIEILEVDDDNTTLLKLSERDMNLDKAFVKLTNYAKTINQFKILEYIQERINIDLIKNGTFEIRIISSNSVELCDRKKSLKFHYDSDERMVVEDWNEEN